MSAIRPSAGRMLVLALIVGACGACTTATTASTAATTTTTPIADTRIPVILDYSPTVSDLGALVFLAVHPDLRLIGVTLPGPGESHCEFGVPHTRGALVALGLDQVPVACGADTGYGELNPFPAEWRGGADTIDLPEAEANETRSASDLIAALLAEASTPVEIVAVGPLTNLALLLDDHPEVADRIAGITIMGGAVDVPGNVPLFAWESANGYAEVNFWVDPDAAARVIASRLAITLVPLDATNFLPADAMFLEVLGSEPASIASGLLERVWLDAPEWIAGEYFLWDELAAAILGDETMVEFETRLLVVDTGDDSVAGWSREDPSGAPVRVAVRADRAAFEAVFLTAVLGRSASVERLVATAAEIAYFDAVGEITAQLFAAEEEVFLAAAVELGYEATDLEGLPEEAFFEVIVAAIPEIIAGPLAEFHAALGSLEPPESLVAVHDEWAFLVSDVLAHEAEILENIEDAALGLDVPYFTAMTEACGKVAAAAGERGILVDLRC